MRTSNRLLKEKSPYLLQHAHNPVDWYPWSDEAFTRAQREDKPIFLSIGYSTCHWCHVMERESFADNEVAAFLNKHFIAIKVDREERPDIDHLYMLACQTISGQGGWPLTIIMNPDKKPFFAGTYFPKESKYGRPGLIEVLRLVQDHWENKREELEETAREIVTSLQPRSQADEKKLAENTLEEAYRILREDYDSKYGGFGQAPKFPMPHNLFFLFRYYHWTGEREALSMGERTLETMHRGGIYDHLGYGFSRYSVDREWLIPHFEKMLYDNALLAMAYLEGYQISGRERFARIAREIFTYVLRDMTSPGGAFYSAQDADSEGEEGKYYTWTPGEIREVLGDDLGEKFCHYYGVTKAGNFAGKNVLNRIHALNTPGDPREEESLAVAYQKLFAAREGRSHPHRDDKVLTSWNGLMIAALAMGARILAEPEYLRAARKALDFIRNHLHDQDGRLLARYRDGDAAHPAYLDDHATLIWALLELYQADPCPSYLRWALSLQEELDHLFWDEEDGGYFFSGSDGEELFVRSKAIHDGAMPSGNSMAALNLTRLGRLTGREEYLHRADRLLQAFSQSISHYPAGYTFSLLSLHQLLFPGREIVVVTPPTDGEMREQLTSLGQIFAPTTTLLYLGGENGGEELKTIAPFVGKMTPLDGKVTYYICEDFTCRQPTTDFNRVKAILVGKG
ncbi:MAG: thioredoxin domain-containing protein [Firmicutes bacterium]|nr:thioredoxin domain-containing protein [Bacillota bacterium]